MTLLALLGCRPELTCAADPAAALDPELRSVVDDAIGAFAASTGHQACFERVGIGPEARLERGELQITEQSPRADVYYGLCLQLDAELALSAEHPAWFDGALLPPGVLHPPASEDFARGCARAVAYQRPAIEHALQPCGRVIDPEQALFGALLGYDQLLPSQSSLEPRGVVHLADRPSELAFGDDFVITVSDDVSSGLNVRAFDVDDGAPLWERLLLDPPGSFTRLSLTTWQGEVLLWNAGGGPGPVWLADEEGLSMVGREGWVRTIIEDGETGLAELDDAWYRWSPDGGVADLVSTEPFYRPLGGSEGAWRFGDALTSPDGWQLQPRSASQLWVGIADGHPVAQEHHLEGTLALIHEPSEHGRWSLGGVYCYDAANFARLHTSTGRVFLVSESNDESGWSGSLFAPSL